MNENETTQAPPAVGGDLDPKDEVNFVEGDRTELCQAAIDFIRCVNRMSPFETGDEWKQSHRTASEDATYEAALALLRREFAAGPKAPQFHTLERNGEACRKK
ncbi:hypothetical protein SH501x_001425 [Pirellulaceae bacterium SH501]